MSLCLLLLMSVFVHTTQMNDIIHNTEQESLMERKSHNSLNESIRKVTNRIDENLTNHIDKIMDDDNTFDEIDGTEEIPQILNNRAFGSTQRRVNQRISEVGADGHGNYGHRGGVETYQITSNEHDELRRLAIAHHENPSRDVRHRSPSAEKDDTPDTRKNLASLMSTGLPLARKIRDIADKHVYPVAARTTIQGIIDTHIHNYDSQQT